MKAAIFAIFALALAAPAFAQIDRDRSCLTPPITPGFSVAGIVGAWYEISTYPIASLPAKCTGHVLYEADDGSVNFIVMYLDQNSLDAYEFTGNGLADVAASSVDVTFTTGLSLNMQFVHSDYLTYAVMYGCIETGPSSSTEFAWVVSNTPTLSAEAYAEVASYVAANLDADAFVDTPQDYDACYGAPGPTKH